MLLSVNDDCVAVLELYFIIFVLVVGLCVASVKPISCLVLYS